MAGHGQVGLDLQAIGAVGRRAEPFGGARGAHAGGPDDGACLEFLAAIDDAVGRAFGDGLAQHHLDAEAFQRGLRIGREIVGKAARARAGPPRSAPRAPCACRCGGSPAAACPCARSAMVPASSTPVGPAPMMTKVSSAARRSGSVSRSARSKATRMPPPDRRGVLERLQARRERLPLVMAEIGVARAGREHQRVIGNAVAVFEQHALSCRIDAVDVGEQRRHLGAVAQEIADRPGDLAGGERSGRDLVEQRLEQMMVAAIDQRDLDRRTGKTKVVSSPPKPAPTITTRWGLAGAVVIGSLPGSDALLTCSRLNRGR